MRIGGVWCDLKSSISGDIHTQILQSHGLRHTMSVWVTITDAHVYIRERGGGERGEYGLRNTISTVIHTWIRQSHGLRQIMPVWVAITDAPVYMRERGAG